MARRYLPLVLVLMALLLAAAPGLAQEAALDPNSPLPVDPNVTVGELPNGLRYYIRENREPQERAELRLVVNAGSVLEDEDQLGLAHFVEHMAFNGTVNFQKQELVDYLERIGMRFGADVNAYTSFDETVYILTVPTDSAEIVETGFQILEDWAHGLSFDHEEIDKERGVVIEEWRLGRGAGARMLDEQLPILLKDSHYAERLPIGEKEILETFDYEVPKRFYRDWYRPDLMAVVAVGDFDAADIRRSIEQHFAGIPAASNPRERVQYPVPDHDETLFAIASDEEATFSSVSVYWKQGPSDEGTVAAYRQSIVESLFNQMLNSRLFELTQEADPPFLGASSGQGRLIGSKEFYILGAGVKDNGVERGLEVLLLEGERVARYGFTESELEREKAELLRAMEHAFAEREKTNSSAYASEYVRSFLWDEPIPGIAVEFELHKKLVPEIALDAVNRLANEWIVDRNRVVLAGVPEKEGVEIPTESGLAGIFAAVVDAEIEPYEDVVVDAPLVASAPVPGDIVGEELLEDLDVLRWTLSNGVRVVLKSTDFKDDEIVFQGLSPGGTSLASDEDYVAASTAAALVSQSGVGEFDLIQLQKALAGTRVRVSPGITSLLEGFTGRASPDDVETMFQLIYLYFTAPRRDEQAFLSFTSRIQAFLANRNADPQAAFQDTLSVTLSQHSFRSRPPSPEVYEEMNLDVSLDFYKNRFADAGDFTFVFVGSFDPAELKPLVRTYLASLPSSGRDENWRDLGIEPPAGVIERVVYKGIEPKSQTRVVFTGPFEWTRENRHAIRALNDVMRIRLREVLREDMGGTYGVSVSGGGRRDPRPRYNFSIGFGSDPERLEELVSAVFVEIDRLKTSGPTEEEVAKVKETMRRSRETNLRDNDYWLGQLLAAERYGLDPNNILNYEELIDALTGEMVREAANKYLRTDNYVRVSLYPEDWQASSR